MKSVDERLISALSPGFGIRNVYVNITADELETDASGQYVPFCVVSSIGGDILQNMSERMYDRNKSNWRFEVCVCAARAEDARSYSKQAETAIISSNEFITARALNNCQDDIIREMNLYARTQDFDLWASNL